MKKQTNGSVLDTVSSSRWLSVGSWVLMEYGYSHIKFCVIEETENMVLLLPKEWCVSSARWMNKSDVEQRALFLGRGKKNWLRPIFFAFNDIIHPYFMYR